MALEDYAVPEEEMAYLDFLGMVNNGEYKEAYDFMLKKPYVVQSIMGIQASFVYQAFARNLGDEKAVDFGILYLRDVLGRVDSDFLESNFFPTLEERTSFNEFIEMIDRRSRKIKKSKDAKE